MDLEQRVQILEQELEILKNQIQATLLDMQEHLLTNAYPSLRADDVPPPSDGGYNGGGGHLASYAPRGEEMKQETFSNVRRVSIDDSGTAYEMPTPQQQTPPPTLRYAAPEPAPRPANVEATPQRTAPETDWSTMSELEEWASEKVKEMGTKRTRKLIEMHYRKGHFDDNAKEMLLGLISLYEEETPPNNQKRTPVAQARPASLQPAPKPVRQAQPAPRQQPVAQARPVENQQATPAQKPAADPRPTQPARRRKEATSVEEDAPQNLVLKLIAGVQNAGAGVTRRKHNG